MNPWFCTAAALAVILISGGGITLMGWRGRQPPAIAEALGWSWLLGSGFLTIFVAATGPLLPPGGLIALTTLVGAICGYLGWKRRGGRSFLAIWPVEGAAWEKWLTLAPALALLWSCWAASRNTIIWDGLFNWEFKAHAAMLNGGHFPSRLFSDPAALAMHPSYPLHLPALELWIYLWLGHGDQSLVRVLFPVYYFSATVALWAVVARSAGRLWAGALAAALPVFVPNLLLDGQLLFGGYADFELATLYLAAVGALAQPDETGHPGGQWLLSALAASLMIWTKQEGLLLWIAYVCTAILLLRHRGWRAPLLAALPGLVVLVAWKGTLAALAAIPEVYFLPINAKNLALGFQRVPFLAAYFSALFQDRESWGLLWWSLPAALACLVWRRDQAAPLAAAVILPLCLDQIPYLLFKDNLAVNVQNSASRLVLQDSLVAVLILGLAAAGRSARPTADSLVFDELPEAHAALGDHPELPHPQ